jgi:hypothetical protein
MDKTPSMSEITLGSQPLKVDYVSMLLIEPPLEKC